MSEYQEWLDSESDFPSDSRWIVKASSPGHPRNGHEGYAALSTAASATMLPQATFELAQLEMPPPHPPTAGAPQALGARHQLKLFVAVTSVQPPRAYVYDGGVLTLREREAIAQAVAKTKTRAAAEAAAEAPGGANPLSRSSSYALWMGPWNAADASGLGADAVAKQIGKKGARKLRARAERAATSVFRWLSLPGRLGDPHGDLQFSIGEFRSLFSRRAGRGKKRGERGTRKRLACEKRKTQNLSQIITNPPKKNSPQLRLRDLLRRDRLLLGPRRSR